MNFVTLKQRASAMSAVALLIAMPTHAAFDNSFARETGFLIASNKSVLAVNTAQSLSVRAHVSSFDFQPGMDEIVFTGQDESDANRFIVKRVALDRGSDIELMSSKEAGPHGANPFRVAGWSADGRYLLIEAQHSPELDATNTKAYYIFDSTELNDPPTRIPLPEAFNNARTAAYWSPAKTQVLVVNPAVPGVIYNPSNKSEVSVPERQGAQLVQWQSDTTLLYKTDSGFLGLNLSDNTFSAIDPGTVAATVPADDADPTQSDTCGRTRVAAFPGVLLVARLNRILRNPKDAPTEIRTLWLQKDEKFGKSNAVLVAAISNATHPMACWSDDGKYIGFTANGELNVSWIRNREATPKELVDNGFDIPCKELNTIAAGNLKQIGLALMEYVQDNDEMYPSSDGINDKIYPYIKDANTFATGKAHFQYHASTDLSMAHMDNPAQTIIGSYDTPCSKITLYADGHVKGSAMDSGSGSNGPTP